MIIKFQIVKSIVREAVQTTTYIKGQVDRTAQNASNAIVQVESVSDETYQERSFTHDFDTALEKLKVVFVDYIVPTPQTIGDNAIYYNNRTDDIVEFVLSVSKRYNGTLTDTLARLSAKYIEDYIVFLWWLKTGNAKQAEPYQAILTSNEQEIRKCFVLSAPSIPTTPYTSTLSISNDTEDEIKDLTISLGGSISLSYSIDDGTVDDIEAKSSNPGVVEIHRSAAKCSFLLNSVGVGSANVTLYSKHSDTLSKTFTITIKKE